MTAHIQMLEPEVVKACSVSFPSLEKDTTGRSLGKLLSVLDNQGFAIVTDVLSPEECAAAEQMFADDLRGIVDLKDTIKRGNKVCQDPLNRWNTTEFPLSSKPTAFATDYGLPHGQCGWAVRSHPNIKSVYEQLFHTEELCVGMDNLFFSPNRPSEKEDEKRVDRLWPHADQNSNLAPQGKYDCYQGVLYVWPSDIDSSTTVVWPGSHKSVFPKLMTKRSFRGHFCMIDREDHPEFVEHARRIPVPAGGLLLWSSKAIHQGWGHGKRLAVPVCYEPSKRRSEAALKSKIQCCKDGTPTTHWASLGKPHSVAASGAKQQDGGTSEFPLRHVAHKHILDAKGEVSDAIVKFL